MTRAASIDRVTDYFDQGEFAGELSELVAFETESQEPTQAAELSRYLNEAIAPRLSRMGFDCTIHANPAEGAGPILTADRLEEVPVVIGAVELPTPYLPNSVSFVHSKLKAYSSA